MLINTRTIIDSAQFQTVETEPVDINFQYPDVSQGYLKYGFYSRKAYFFHAYYKAFHLESFKGNINNAKILAEILSYLITYFIPCPAQFTIITTPKRAHFEKLGYHFSSEILKIVSAQTGISFLEDIVTAHDKNKVNPIFYQQKNLPLNSKLLLYDDILTTGRTISTTLEILKSNPANNLASVNIPVIIGINNN